MKLLSLLTLIQLLIVISFLIHHSANCFTLKTMIEESNQREITFSEAISPLYNTLSQVLSKIKIAVGVTITSGVIYFKVFIRNVNNSLGQLANCAYEPQRRKLLCWKPRYIWISGR